ncbi:zinc-binding dehydrogenase [Fusarium proliferatum]|nr:zinc-binding dehydrogenase [Fusarium proliferatum]
MSNRYRKVVIPRYGDASVLEIVEDTLAAPVSRHVQVAPIDAGFSGADVHMRRGVYPSQQKPPLTPGYCLVGTVKANGTNSNIFKPGDIVACLTKYDAQAELVNLPEKHLIPVPAGLDLQQVTALVLDWSTAYAMVHQVAKVKSGQKVFVHGVSGSVGYATMKLAQLRGAKVYGTASERNHAAIREQGGVPFVYTDKNWIKVMKDGGGVDAAFDSIGFDSFEESYDILNDHGIVVGFGANQLSLTGEALISAIWPTVKFLLKGRVPWRSKRTYFYRIDRDQPEYRPNMNTLLDLLGKGEIHVPIRKVWDLDDIQEAHPFNPQIPSIFDAALYDNYDEVCSLIQQNVDVNAINPNTGATALHMASGLERGRMVKILLEAGADHSIVEDLHETPMHQAAITGNCEAVKLLLEAGASPHGKGRDGSTPTHMAAWNGHTDALKLLINAGADIHAVDEMGQTPLHVAANHGAGPATLQIPLKAGGDINARSDSGETPLLAAGGYDDMVEFLVQEGAGLEIADNNGMTALHIAARDGVRSQIQFILDTNIFDVNGKTKDGMTSLHFAATKSYCEDITSLLLDSGADIDEVDNDGNTALHLACESWQDSVVKILLDKRADTEKKNKNNGETPLHVAARIGRIGPLRALLEAGADPRTTDQNGRTPRQSADAAKAEQIVLQIEEWEKQGPHSDELNSQVRGQILKAAETWDEICSTVSSLTL